MKGAHKFCPESGVELSTERHYDASGIPWRAPEDDVDEDHYGAPPEGLLTCGDLVSSRLALANYFRRCHQRHHEPDEGLYRAMALALRRLKTSDDDDDPRGGAWDVWVWYALAERLARKGHDVRWMHYHADARCPRCSCQLVWELTPRGRQGRCPSCGDDNYRDGEIRDRIRALYRAAFDESIDDLETI